jgi:excisionase family DNA binding protein
MVKPWRAAVPSPFVNSPALIAATIVNVSRQTGLSRSEIYRLLALGKLKAVKSGRSTLVLMDSVLEHMASLPPATFRPEGWLSVRYRSQPLPHRNSRARCR